MSSAPIPVAIAYDFDGTLSPGAILCNEQLIYDNFKAVSYKTCSLCRMNTTRPK